MIELLGLAVKDLRVNSSGLESEESNTQSSSEMIVESNVEVSGSSSTVYIIFLLTNIAQ